MYSSYQQQLQMDEGAALGLLQHLDTAELQQLLEDETKLSNLISDLQQVKNLEVEKETLLTSNKSVAEYNLSKQPRIQEAKEQLATTYEKAVEIQKDFETNKQKLEYHAAQQSLDTTLALIQTEAAKSEEESEDMTEKFMDGDMEVEDFVESYLAKRKLMHLRRVKVEKLQEIIRQKNAQPARATTSAQNYFAPKPHVPYPGAGATSNSWGTPAAGSVPYPTGPYSMPDPSAYLPR